MSGILSFDVPRVYVAPSSQGARCHLPPVAELARRWGCDVKHVYYTRSVELRAVRSKLGDGRAVAMKIEVVYPVRGTVIASDHLYPLYGALSRIIPQFHQAESGFRFGPITGARGERGLLRLNLGSRLRARVPADQVALVLPLAGRSLEVGAHAISLGVPTVAALIPATTLAARVVIYKNATEPTRFLDVTRRKLDGLGVAGEPGILLARSGPRAGEPRRQVLRIKGKRVVGYALQVAGLTAEESMRLQEESISGRALMGCGFFVPYSPRES